MNEGLVLLLKCPRCDETNIAERARKMVQINDKSLRERSKGKMNDVLEAQALFKDAFPRWRYSSVKDMINDGYRVLSRQVTKEFTHRRVETIWQGTARRIDGEEKDALRLAAVEEHRREQKELRARLAALDERLSTTDPEFHGPSLEAYRAQASGLGRVHHDREDRG